MMIQFKRQIQRRGVQDDENPFGKKAATPKKPRPGYLMIRLAKKPAW
jgi:hypothetical protein